MTVNVKFGKENSQKPTYYNFNFFFRYARLFTAKFSRTSTIHPGIFGGRTLCADSVSADEDYRVT